MEDVREIFNQHLLLLAILLLCFYSSRVCKGFLHHHNLDHLLFIWISENPRGLEEMFLLSAFQIRHRLQNPGHSVLLQCKCWKLKLVISLAMSWGMMLVKGRSQVVYIWFWFLASSLRGKERCKIARVELPSSGGNTKLSFSCLFNYVGRNIRAQASTVWLGTPGISRCSLFCPS